MVWRDIPMSCLRSNHHLKRLQGIIWIPFIPCKVRCVIFLIVRVKTIKVGTETSVEPSRRFILSGTVTGAIVIILVRCRKLHVITSLRQAISYNHILLWRIFVNEMYFETINILNAIFISIPMYSSNSYNSYVNNKINAESSHDLTHYLAVFNALGDNANSDSYNEYKCFNCWILFQWILLWNHINNEKNLLEIFVHFFSQNKTQKKPIPQCF